MPSTRTRRLIIIAMLSTAAVLFAIAVIVFRDTPSSTSLPIAIREVSPAPMSNVFLQQDVRVDLASGYTGIIDINGVPIPETQVIENVGLNRLTFRPGPGQVLERLFTERNCVRIEYWLISEGQNNSQMFTWCFDAS